MMIPKFLVTLVRADRTTWVAGEFNSQEAANLWAREAQTQPDWDEATQIQITDLTTQTLPSDQL